VTVGVHLVPISVVAEWTSMKSSVLQQSSRQEQPFLHLCAGRLEFVAVLTLRLLLSFSVRKHESVNLGICGN
jgi:hypothetical protein